MPRAVTDRQSAVADHPLTELVKAFAGLELKFTRGDAANVGEQLKLGEAELGIACPLHEPWERLESWVLFTERFELAVPKSHPLATRNSLILSQLGDTRLLPRSYCEQSQVLGNILSAHGLSHDFQDRIASDHDLMSLLAANVGLSFIPQSSLSLDTLRLVQVQDLEFTRPVVLYAVSGRQRSPAATGLMRLLRSANWPAVLGRPDAGAEQAINTASGGRATSASKP